MKIKLTLSLLMVLGALLGSAALAGRFEARQACAQEVGLAPEAPSLLWRVLGGGGGQVSGGTTVLAGTIGQGAVGGVAYESTSLCSGFWCGADALYLPENKVYLPLMRR